MSEKANLDEKILKELSEFIQQRINDKNEMSIREWDLEQLSISKEDIFDYLLYFVKDGLLETEIRIYDHSPDWDMWRNIKDTNYKIEEIAQEDVICIFRPII